MRRPARDRRPLTAVAVALCALATACTSTAREEAAPAGDAGVPSAPPAADAVLPAAIPGDPRSAAPDSPAAAGVARGPAARAAGAGAGAAAAPGGSVSSSITRWPTGPGVTATEISIGVAINDAAFAQMYNAGIGVDLGDPLRAAQVVADILNEQGGVAGRRIRLINYRHTGDSNAYAAQVCARFTEEVQVFTVLQFSPSGPTTRKCFGDRRMPVIDGFSSAVSARDALPHHYGIASMTLERLATTLVDRLHATGFFARGKRIGVVTYDDEVHRRVVSQVLVPRLERHSRNVTAIAHLKGGLGDEANAANAVTAFRRDRVELVIIFEGGAGVSGPFTHAAAAQQASFGYGLASVTHPSAQAHGRKYLVHEDALRRATVVGWSPLSDLRYDRGGVRELPPLAHDWRRRLAARGLTYRESCCALGAALVMVDRLRFLKAGLEAVQGEGVGRERLRAGVEGLGSTFSSVLTTRTEFRPGRHDGAAAVRYASWDDACGCLTYRSGAIPLPR